MRQLQLLSIFLVLTFSACSQQVPVDNITRPPLFSEADKQYADVFKPLDGQWKGTFKIYQDTILRERNPELLDKPTVSTLQTLPLKLADTIVVTQVYESSSSYFQTVEITDYYPGKDETVISNGVNKVQDGEMWCIVRKPDDTVIHEGSTDGARTIIWQRDRQEPLAQEYFRETVEENTYEIVGWGYYPGNDTSKMPVYWFYGKYFRQ